MKPVSGKASASAIRCSPPPNPISSPTFDRRVEQLSETRRRCSSDVEREARQQLLDQVGLVRAQFVTLAPSEERTLPVLGNIIVRRWVAVVRVADCDTHRSVWYS